MCEQTKSFSKIAVWIGIICIIIRYVISIPESAYEWYGHASEAVTFAGIIIVAYERYLWRLLPSHIPKLKKSYKGKIIFNYNGEGEKEVQIDVKQTYLSISIKITSEQMNSVTVCGRFVKEYADYVLYYTYITNPLSKYSEENPIQYGTCRLQLKNKNMLHGTYWTNRKTKGDITMSACT